MTHLLHVDSSLINPLSTSRLLGAELVREWSRREPGAVLTYRDLAAEPLEFVDAAWYAAAFTPEEARDEQARLALLRSDQLIAEVEAADVLVVGAPMHNFGVPAPLKAWIDQVVRIGRTFGYDGPTPVGLLQGKRAVVLATSGGDALSYEQLGLDHRTSYLRAVLGFIGITDVEVVTVTGTMADGLDLTAARAEIAELVARSVPAAITA